MQCVSMRFEFNVTLNCQTGSIMIVPTVVASASPPRDNVRAVPGHPFPEFWFAPQPMGEAPLTTSTARHRMAPTLLNFEPRLLVNPTDDDAPLPPHPTDAPRSFGPAAGGDDDEVGPVMMQHPIPRRRW